MRRVLILVLALIAPTAALAAFAIFQVNGVFIPPAVSWLLPTLTPVGTSCGTGNNSCIIKVSSSAGVDGTCAATSPPIVQNTDASACQTIAKAVTLLRDGKPDWLLLKTGDTFTNDNFGSSLKVSGLSQSQLMVFATYGTSTAKPIFQVDAAHTPCIVQGVVTGAPKSDYLLVAGIDWYNYTRDPNNGSFSAADARVNTECFQWQFQGTTAFHYLNWENNTARFFGLAYDIDPDAEEPVLHPCTTCTMVLNGNIIVDDYPPNYNVHSQGAFISGLQGSGSNSLVMTFNVFDGNGFNSTLAGPISATMTCASPSVFTITGSPVVVFNGAVVTLNGTPCTGFSTNTAYCAINVSGSTFNVTASSGAPCPNGTTTLNGTGSSSGLNVTVNDYGAQIFNRNVYLNGTPATASHNIFSNSSSEGVQFRSGGGPFTNNLFFNNSQCWSIGDGFTGTVTGTSNNNVCMNSGPIIQGTGNLARGDGTQVQDGVAGMVFTGNIIAHSSVGASSNGGVFLDAATSGVAVQNNVICWPTVFVDSGSGNTTTPNTTSTTTACTGLGLADPTRTVATYDSTILGGPGTNADFVACARGNSQANWNAKCTAPNVNSWIRPGYNMTPYLLKRDLDPAANDNTPMWLDKVG